MPELAWRRLLGRQLLGVAEEEEKEEEEEEEVAMSCWVGVAATT